MGRYRVGVRRRADAITIRDSNLKNRSVFLWCECVFNLQYWLSGFIAYNFLLTSPTIIRGLPLMVPISPPKRHNSFAAHKGLRRGFCLPPWKVDNTRRRRRSIDAPCHQDITIGRREILHLSMGHLSRKDLWSAHNLHSRCPRNLSRKKAARKHDADVSLFRPGLTPEKWYALEIYLFETNRWQRH